MPSTSPLTVVFNSDDIAYLSALPVAAEWRRLGLQLRAYPHQLDAIQANHAGAPDLVTDCLTGMFEWWLRNSDSPTVQQLIDALCTIERRDVARKVADKYNVPLPPTLPPLPTPTPPPVIPIPSPTLHKWKVVIIAPPFPLNESSPDDAVTLEWEDRYQELNEQFKSYNVVLLLDAVNEVADGGTDKDDVMSLMTTEVRAAERLHQILC